jgi:hypothetical protein
MADDPQYGVDWSCTTGLDPLGRLASGSTLMAQVCLRQLYCRNGRLWKAPNRVTLDVRDFVGQGIVAARDIQRIQAQCEAAIVADERILRATVLATFDGRVLTLQCTGMGSQGPFTLVLAVTAVTVDILRQN